MERLALRKLRLRCGVFGVLIREWLGKSWVPGRLFGLAVESVAAKVGIIFLFLKTTGRIEALLITGCDVTGDRLPFGNGLGALECDDVAWHKM